MKQNLKILTAAVKRLGVVIEPNGDQLEADGMLNPASAFDREGNLILYPRVVAPGNQSRVGLIKVSEDKHGNAHPERLGYALVPEADYERNGACGQGCEDPRVTFVPDLDVYLMAYTAYGTQGPRPAIAFSRDAYNWDRLGLIEFPQELQLSPDDKDVAFFPAPVLSPNGVLSIAFYHRPMVDIPAEGGMDFIQTVLSKRPDQRQCIRIAYVPLDLVRADLKNLVKVAESVVVLVPGSSWG
ncbi:MAG TPA: hypothetical protein V6C72_10685, partial [Chroococcales cyanobacterium]